MPTTTVENEILERENRYWEAIKARDIEGAMRLTDFPCLVAGASGVGLILSQPDLALSRGLSSHSKR